jgi:hypothetical protein
MLGGELGGEGEGINMRKTLQTILRFGAEYRLEILARSSSLRD